jgi:hypothetical protein
VSWYAGAVLFWWFVFGCNPALAQPWDPWFIALIASIVLDMLRDCITSARLWLAQDTLRGQKIKA